ncbi:MAG TPA: barstar family protein [Pseudonocardiaceae bacterium]|jgi:RNAse (barnase) inhibitor barstar
MPHYAPDAASVITSARDRGALTHLVAPVTSKAGALDEIGSALDCPSWYGRNLDALYDCLTDLSWLPDGEHVLVWAGHRLLATADPVSYRDVLQVLDDAVAAGPGRPLLVVLTDA